MHGILAIVRKAEESSSKLNPAELALEYLLRNRISMEWRESASFVPSKTICIGEIRPGSDM